jgi:hypothetical protein
VPLLTYALIAIAAFILGLRVGIAFGYRGARKRLLEEARRKGAAPRLGR